MNGTITKRPLGNRKFSWGYTFFSGRTPEGKRIQVTKSGFPTKGEASTKLREAIAEHETKESASDIPIVNDTPARDSRTVAEYVQYWLDTFAVGRRSPKTLERDRELAGYLNKDLGSIPLVDLKTSQVDEAILKLRSSGGLNGRPLSAKTVREIMSVLSLSLRKAEAHGIIPKSPMAPGLVDLPRSEEPVEKRILQDEEFKMFFEAIEGHWLSPILLVASATGMRRGELCALDWPSFQPEQSRLLISKSLEQTRAGLRIKRPKNGKRRECILPGFISRMLLEHRERQEQERRMYGADYRRDLDLMFPDPGLAGNYIKPDSLTAKVCQVAQRLDLKGIGLHSFRHTHASKLHQLGVPDAAIASRLGHSSAAITRKIYTHTFDAADAATAKTWGDNMAELLKSAGPNRMLADVSARNEKSALLSQKVVGFVGDTEKNDGSANGSRTRI